MANFRRTIEDFVCERCGAEVTGSGYTNHCPACLWSKHVDINPGDRAAACGGLMEPVGLDRRGDAYTILHRCLRCGHAKPNKSAAGDNFSALLALARKIAE
jgi:hypothetical protein